MRILLLVVVVILGLVSRVSAQEGKSTTFKLGVACSVATNILDVHSTWYALHDKRLGLREGNLWLVRTSENDWGKLAGIKAAGTGVVVGAAWYIDERGEPFWANALLYGDCALKGATAARNYYLANQQKDKLQNAALVLTMKVSF